VADGELAEGVAKDAAAELVAVVGEHALQAPAGGLELGRDAARESARVLGAGPLVGGGDEVGPGVA
jgi:hypothetical protein